jgi:hypothetical protein
MANFEERSNLLKAPAWILCNFTINCTLYRIAQASCSQQPLFEYSLAIFRVPSDGTLLHRGFLGSLRLRSASLAHNQTEVEMQRSQDKGAQKALTYLSPFPPTTSTQQIVYLADRMRLLLTFALLMPMAISSIVAADICREYIEVPPVPGQWYQQPNDVEWFEESDKATVTRIDKQGIHYELFGNTKLHGYVDRYKLNAAVAAEGNYFSMKILKGVRDGQQWKINIKHTDGTTMKAYWLDTGKWCVVKTTFDYDHFDGITMSARK